MSEHLLQIIQRYQSGTNRITWDEHFICQALLISMRSPSLKLKVGAVIVNDKNRQLSSGYNGYLPNFAHKSIIRDNHEISTIHAEVNCIINAANSGTSTNGGIIYTTHYPCLHCFQLIVASGIKTIKYFHDYHNDSLVIKLAEEANMDIIKI